MGYYCTVPQCTSLAGKTKNVKFHRFPRDLTMADKWNVILKRGKPYTKYSKVCSLHFTQSDYNVTTMGQWKTLSKDAVPSQNLPKLNPDGSVMVIRKSRTIKYREGRKEETISEKTEKWALPINHTPMQTTTPEAGIEHDSNIAYRLQTLSAIASTLSPQIAHTQNPSTQTPQLKPKKDAFMQTDPVQSEEDDTQPNNSYSETSENSFSSEHLEYPVQYQKDSKEYPAQYQKDSKEYPAQYQKDSKEYPAQYQKDSKEYPAQYQKDSKEYPAQYQKDSKEYPTQYKDSKDAYSSQYKEKEYPAYEKGKDYIQSYQKDPMQYKEKEYQYQKDTKDYEYQKDTKDFEYQKDTKEYENAEKKYETPKDYTKQEDYLPQTNEEYNKEAEKYALERKSHNGYEKSMDTYQKQLPIENGYQKIPEIYTFDKEYQRNDYIGYQNSYTDSVEILRNQQHNIEMLQQQHRVTENQNFFNENHIKQEIDMNSEEEKFLYERTKDQLDANSMYPGHRGLQQQLLEHLQHQVKREPDANGCDNVMQPQGSPYYAANGHSNVTGGYYEPISRPGPELLIAKQNALAAHTQLWQNTMKRPFFYSESTHYTGPQLLHRYEDLTRILQ